MIDLLLTPISMFGETAYLWSENIALFALLGFVVFYVLSVVVLGPQIGEPALFASVFTAMIGLFLVESAVENNFIICDNEASAKACIAKSLRDKGALDKSLTIDHSQVLTLSELNQWKETKNIDVLLAIIHTYEIGSSDVPKDKETAALWAKKTLEIAYQSKYKNSIALLVQHQGYLSKTEVKSYLNQTEKSCEMSSVIYGSTGVVQEVGRPMIDKFAKANCIQLYNQYH